MRHAPPQSSLSYTPPGARANAQAAAPRISPAAIPNRPKPAPHERLRSTAPVFPSRYQTTHDLLSLGLRAHACPAPSAAATTASSVILPAAAPCRAAFPSTTRPVISSCTAEHIAADHPLLVSTYTSILDMHGAARPQHRRASHWIQRIRHDASPRGDDDRCRAALYAPPPPLSRLTAWSSPSQNP
ncbi:hypothetical protein B0H11DRAFT_2130561 [Mycena galericulata]|nr:hypothetical protein B0H11DRAFT_2130561 [Mycena galericulata]